MIQLICFENKTKMIDGYVIINPQEKIMKKLTM